MIQESPDLPYIHVRVHARPERSVIEYSVSRYGECLQKPVREIAVTCDRDYTAGPRLHYHHAGKRTARDHGHIHGVLLRHILEIHYDTFPAFRAIVYVVHDPVRAVMVLKAMRQQYQYFLGPESLSADLQECVVHFHEGFFRPFFGYEQQSSEKHVDLKDDVERESHESVERPYGTFSVTDHEKYHHTDGHNE